MIPKLTPKERRGIAPAITTLILLGIAGLAGGGVFLAFNQQSSIATDNNSMQVTESSMVVDTNGNVFGSMTVKNIGSKTTDDITVQLQVDTDTGTAGIQPFTVNTDSVALNPGDTSSFFVEITDTGGAPVAVDIGEVITFSLLTEYSDGSSVRNTGTVTISIS